MRYIKRLYACFRKIIEFFLKYRKYSVENAFWRLEIPYFHQNKFDPNKDASNICENERIFLNLLEFT